MFWFSLQVLSHTFLILRRTERDMIINVYGSLCKVKGKSVPLQACSGPEGSRKLRFQISWQWHREVVRLSALPIGNFTDTHFCYRLSRPQGHRKDYVNEKFQWHHLESNQRPSDLQHSILTTVTPRSPYVKYL